jgi:cytochrome oxidase Cu insertion factor (SCO1/SenC/PrrC family)
MIAVGHVLLAALLTGSAAAGEDGEVGDPALRSTPWGADYFPNVPLVTQEGTIVRFFDDLLAGKVVVVNFIYTSCPDACPLETAKLAEVYRLLDGRVGRDVFFYSISIDPERDTPDVLREYAARHQTGPGWLFLTGAAEDIALVRRKLGMLRTGEEALEQHTLSLMIGNQATGKWMKRSPMENPYLLATQIGSWLHDWKLPPEPGLDYASAPELRSITRGESLFRTRCATCHLLGPEDGIARQGPNLIGVTERRERAWLARWLAEPDAMLAEGDPDALELFEAYRNLPMPNMRLNALEVEALLEYIEEESSWYAAPAAAEDELSEAEEASDGVPFCCQKEGVLVLGDDGDGGDGAQGARPSLELDPWQVPLSVAPAPAPRPRSAPPLALLLCSGLSLALGLLGGGLGRRRYALGG